MNTPTIFHNPKCSASRSTLALMRERGVEPKVIEYLKTPPERAVLLQLIEDSGLGARGVLRGKEAMCRELGLDAPGVNDQRLVDAMLAHPVLINRPIVVTTKGTRLCRPADLVLELL